MLIKLGKIFVISFLIYVSWFYGTYGPNNLLLYGLALGSTVVVVMDMMSDSKRFNYGCYPLVVMMFAYGVYALISSLFTSEQLQYSLTTLLTYFAYIVICYDACYISKRDESMEWILNGFLLAAIMCATQTIFWGKEFLSSGYVVKTMGPENNPNSLGLVLLFGIFSAVTRKNYDKRFFVSAGLAFVFLYVITLTGSRKCFIGGVGLIAIWLITYLRFEKKRGFSHRLLIRFCLIVAAVVVAISYAGDELLSSSLFERLMELSDGGFKDNIRNDLYREVFKLWLERPLFGIGYNQFIFNSAHRIMSHSTYGEILACTGLIGSLIWWIPVIKEAWKLFKVSIRKKGYWGYRFRMTLFMLGIELFIGAGQVWHYTFPHLLMIIFIFGFVDTVYMKSEDGQLLEYD